MLQTTKTPALYDKAAAFIISAFILAVTVLRYNGIPDQYAILFAFFRNPESFPNDIYLNNTFFFESSYYFWINNFLGLDQNELISFGWYLVVSAIAVYFAFRILSRHFGLTTPEVFFILLFTSVLDKNVPIHTWGGIIPQGSGTSTMFAKALGLIAVYCMLEGRIWLGAAIVTVTISLHILGDFILLPILFFLIVFNKEIAKRNLAALSLPAAYLLYKTLSTKIAISSAQDTEQLYEAVMAMSQTDDDFLAQSKLALVLFAASFVVFPFFWRRLSAPGFCNPNLVTFLKAVYAASLLVALSATFYAAYGYRLFLYPPLMMLAPVRAMNYYSLFFYLSAFVLIVRSAKLTSIEKASVLLALVMLHGESLGGILYPAVVLMGGTVVSRFSGDRLSWLKSGKALVPLSLALLIALTSAKTVKGDVYQASFDTLGWHHIKRWRSIAGADARVWEAYEKIRDMKHDFIMLPFYRATDGKLVHSQFLNIVARKSNFISDGHHFYFNADLWREHKVRLATLDVIIASIKDGRPLSKAAQDVLRSRKVTVVVVAPDAASLTGWTEATDVGSYRMLRYSN